jgi:hypothetical protein
MTAVSPTENLVVTAPAPTLDKSHLWAGSEFSFSDVLSAINPLQHLPVISTIYRAITGDTIGNVARVVGDGLYGGPIGLASGLIDVASSELTGKDIGEHVIATLEDLGGDSGKKVGSAATPEPAVPSAAAPEMPDPPKLPLLGSATTAGELAAAAPISPLLAPKLAAQTGSASTSPAASSAIRPTTTPGQPIPIDVSPRGIAMMRAKSAIHSPPPVALNLPAGAVASMSARMTPVESQADFADRMREGLAKYDALIASRSRDAKSANIDQSY